MKKIDYEDVGDSEEEFEYPCPLCFGELEEFEEEDLEDFELEDSDE